MLFPTVSRYCNGIYLEGQQVALQLHPLAEGTISVSILGLPSITGFDRRCTLLNDATPSFTPSEIKVGDTRIDCFAVDRFVPALRTGFTLELEPGMAQDLRAWLPKLANVAVASKAVADEFTKHVPPPIYHMYGAITSVVSRIVLDGWAPDHSVAYEREHGIWAREEEFMAQFDTAEVSQYLSTLGERNCAAEKEFAVAG
ncbi:hypothetical protein [Massilia sp. BKSP1R2A-1]|jgi:hypothetical protein|uniref:hypothetical protein n=1 Tax=Massilia sp. BKSP1R2A-1 TaxID=3422595 RepID=UPI003D3381E7